MTRALGRAACPHAADMGRAVAPRPPRRAEGCPPYQNGWRRVRLKRMFSYAKGLNITKADLVDDGVAVVSYGQIHAKHNTGTHLDPSLIRYVPEEIAAACPNSKLKRGDVVFADTSEDLEGVGNCVLNDSDGVVYAGYHALIASARFPEHSKYLSYLFQTDAWRGQIRTRASGIKVFSLTQRVLNPVTVILPPLPEQKRIAAFLDAKCADIDKAIAAKREQLDCIDEMWKNILYKATTQGLDLVDAVESDDRRVAPDGRAVAPRPPRTARGAVPTNTAYAPIVSIRCDKTNTTSNPLFPTIHNDWSLKRIKSIARIRYGLGEPPRESDDGKLMIRATDFHAGKIDGSKMLRVDTYDLPQGKDPYLHTGEIIIVRSGAYAGDSTIVPKCYDGYVSGYDMVLTVTKAMPEFVAYAFLSKHILNDQLLLLSSRAAQPHVNAEQVLNLVLPLPPIPEQRRIIAFLDERRARFDNLADNLRRQIEVLEQYRKSLIHECVMGERRVG